MQWQYKDNSEDRDKDKYKDRDKDRDMLAMQCTPVQASQALQAVQAVQPMLHGESPPMMTPLQQVKNTRNTFEIHNKYTSDTLEIKYIWNTTISMQDPTLLSSMDPAQIAAAVQHCPIPLDSALQVIVLIVLKKWFFFLADFI